MKSLLSASFVFGVLAVVSAKRCFDQVDCPDKMCCTGIPPFGGNCRSLTAEGGKCHIKDDTVAVFGDFVIGPCPCGEDLVCVQQGEKKNDGVCQLPATTTAAPASEEKPAVDEPAVDEPAVDEPAVDEPAVDEPAVDEPAVDEPAVDEPAVDEPAVDEPAVDEPAVDEPAVDEPAVDEPAVDEPAVDEPADDVVAE